MIFLCLFCTSLQADWFHPEPYPRIYVLPFKVLTLFFLSVVLNSKQCRIINSLLLVINHNCYHNTSSNVLQSVLSCYLNSFIDLLDLKPAPNNGTHGRLNNLLRNPVYTPHHPKETSHPSECSFVGQRTFPVSPGCSCRTAVRTEMVEVIEAYVSVVFRMRLQVLWHKYLSCSFATCFFFDLVSKTCLAWG